MENLRGNTNSKIFTANLIFVAICFFLGLAGFGYILAVLPEVATPSGTCITGAWKLALITTHILTFALIPLAMKIFYEGLKRLGFPSRSIFASQLGLAFIMVAVASEIGWHVTQCWYYQNDFTMLNFMFYFFLISAFALWSDGLIKQTTLVSNCINIVFAIGLLAVSILYPLGSEAGNNHYKIPIYILLTLVFSVLTYRGYLALQRWEIVLVPIFSVGVNLVFVYLLNVYTGWPYVISHEALKVPLNALFHILHDLLGTETGVAIFTWLIYSQNIAKQNTLEELAISKGLTTQE